MDNTSFLTPNILIVENLLEEDFLHQILEIVATSSFSAQVYEPPNISESRQRLMLTSNTIAKHLWKQLHPVLPPLEDFSRGMDVNLHLLNRWQPVCVNERLRFYQYNYLERFAPHLDHSYSWHSSKRTFLSVIIYLNEGYLGGNTRFADCVITPKVGRIVIYPHELMHEGEPILAGSKLILRTDIGYERTG